MLTAITRMGQAFESCASFLAQLQELYGVMDRRYQQIADSYGFHCRGCTDSCCRTRFHHHTLIEYLYLIKGVAALAPPVQRDVSSRAEQVCGQLAQADASAVKLRVMCPLNSDGLCRIYAYRPMICRLHGIPSELHPPARPTAYMPGCHVFTEQCGDQVYHPFDRTPLYGQLARLEKAVRAHVGEVPKIRLTVAQMLQTFFEPAGLELLDHLRSNSPELNKESCE